MSVTLSVVGVITSVIIATAIGVGYYWTRSIAQDEDAQSGMQLSVFGGSSSGAGKPVSSTTVQSDGVNEDQAISAAYSPPDLSTSIGLSFGQLRDMAGKVTSRVKKVGGLKGDDGGPGALTILSSTVYTPLAERQETDGDDEELEVRLS